MNATRRRSVPVLHECCAGSRGGFDHPRSGANLTDQCFYSASSIKRNSRDAEAFLPDSVGPTLIDTSTRSEHEGDRLRGNRFAVLSGLSGEQEPPHGKWVKVFHGDVWS